MAKKPQDDLQSSDQVPESVSEWPCKPIVTSSGWLTSWPTTTNTTQSTSQPHSPTAEEAAANKGQLHALFAVSEYLNSALCPNDDDDECYVSEDEDENEGFEDYDFFVKLFKEDEGLREYYEEKREGGVFCCLVCCGVREKGWKRFKDCASLVTHSVTIAKTKKRRAHRAYCQVVCETLGWDFNQLPSIVPLAGDKLDEKPVKAKENVDGGKDCLNGQSDSTISVSVTDIEASLSKAKESQQGKGGGLTELEHNSPSKARGNRSWEEALQNLDLLPDSEWPCKPIVTASGWSSSWPSNNSTQSKSQPQSPTAEEAAANKGQLRALFAVSEYLNSTLSLDNDDDLSEYISDDDDEEEWFEDYDFFVKLFKEDDGLREYYEKNREGGVFCCLVCCGVREKGWKRFKDCVALVQHSTAIAKTKRRRAHRAYSQVVCEILGWDANQLPSIVLSAGDKLSESSDKPVKAQENSVCKAGAADGLVQDLSNMTLETLKRNAEGASNRVEPSKECPVVVNEEKEHQKGDDVHKKPIEDQNHK